MAAYQAGTGNIDYVFYNEQTALSTLFIDGSSDNISTAKNLFVGTTSPVVTSAGLVVDKATADFTNTNGANSHILLTNSSSSGQVSLINYINGAVRSKMRADVNGQINWVATQNHYFYTGGDFGTGKIRQIFTNAGDIYLGADVNASPASATTALTITTNKIGLNNIAPTYTIDAGTSTDALGLPRGTVAQRPTIASSTTPFRYNTDSADSTGLEYGESPGTWRQIAYWDRNSLAYATPLSSTNSGFFNYKYLSGGINWREFGYNIANGTAYVGPYDQTYHNVSTGLKVSSFTHGAYKGNRWAYVAAGATTSTTTTGITNDQYALLAIRTNNSKHYGVFVDSTRGVSFYSTSSGVSPVGVSYSFPKDLLPSTTLNRKSIMSWTGTGGATTSSFDTLGYGLTKETAQIKVDTNKVAYWDKNSTAYITPYSTTNTGFFNYNYLSGSIYWKEFGFNIANSTGNILDYNQTYYNTSTGLKVGYFERTAYKGSRLASIEAGHTITSSITGTANDGYVRNYIKTAANKNYGIFIDSTRGVSFMLNSTGNPYASNGLVSLPKDSSPSTTSGVKQSIVWTGTGSATTVEFETLKRDTAIYITDADYNFSAAITSANIMKRYNRIVIYSKLTSGASSDNQIILHSSSSDFLQCEIIIYSNDASADADATSIDFTTNGAVDGAGGTVSTYPMSAGQRVNIRAVNDGGYKWIYN